MIFIKRTKKTTNNHLVHSRVMFLEFYLHGNTIQKLTKNETETHQFWSRHVIRWMHFWCIDQMCWTVCGNCWKFSPILVAMVNVMNAVQLQSLVIRNDEKCPQHYIAWSKLLKIQLLQLHLTCSSFWRFAYFFIWKKSTEKLFNI